MFRPFPDPGLLPTKPAPKSGEKIVIRVDGLPPYKDYGISIRNPKHSKYERFVKLRQNATTVMDGRSWSDDGISIGLTMYAHGFEKGKTLLDYEAGILDTLDGSHGLHFTYLPLIYQDDCQVFELAGELLPADNAHYVLEITFWDPKDPNAPRASRPA